MDKRAKVVYKRLEQMLGEYNAGLLIAILCDLLEDCLGDKDEINMRSIELKINDFFSSRHEFKE